MPDELRVRAVRLLARRERSRAELRRLLDPQERAPDTVAALLDDLQSRGWLCETRLGEQVVTARRAGAGAARIRAELKRRGLRSDIVARVTDGLDDGDLAAATELWRRRFGMIAIDRSQRERQLRFLLTRGFTRSVALKVLRQAGDRDTDVIQERVDD